MKCLLKYSWVILRRNKVPGGKGRMGARMRPAARFSGAECPDGAVYPTEGCLTADRKNLEDRLLTRFLLK